MTHLFLSDRGKRSTGLFVSLIFLISWLSSVILPPHRTAGAEGLTDGLIAWYNFSSDHVVPAEGGQFTIRDASGNGHDAVTGGSGVTFGTWAEKNLPTVDLPGGNNATAGYIRLPDGLLDDAEEFTVATWIYLRSGNAYTRIFDFGPNTSRYMFLTPTGGNQGALGLAYAITTNGWSTEERVQKGTNLSLNQWVHVAVVQTGSTLAIYENGIKVGERTNMTLNPKSLAPTTNNYIGRSKFASDANINARFADFRVYNRALSPAELLELQGLSDEEAVRADLDSIHLGDLSAVEDDLVLPTAGLYGSRITWESSNPAVISNEGKVTRPSPEEPDAEVTLTATATKGSASATRVFEATVLRLLSDQEKAEFDANAIRLGNLSAVTQDLKLPTVGERHGSQISWTSSDPRFIEIVDGHTGKVTRPEPGEGNAEVALTATVTNGQATTTRTFTAIVLEAPFVLKLVGIRDVRVRTVPELAPQLPDVVIGEYNDGVTTRELPVEWEEISPEQYAQPGTFEVSGAVTGTTLEAKAVVTVDRMPALTEFASPRLEPNEPLQARFFGKNTGGEPLKATAALALYDREGRMADVRYRPFTAETGSAFSGTVELDLPADVSGFRAKAFVWEGEDIHSSGMKPLSRAAVLGDDAAPDVLPATPKGLTATPSPDTPEIVVTWEDSPGATGYDLEIDGVVIPDVTSPYMHSGLALGSTHTYAVRAKIGDRIGAWSLPVSSQATETPSPSRVVLPFRLGEIELHPTLFTENRDREFAFIDSLDPDRMLYNFRVTAGLDTKGAAPLTGWEDRYSKLRGHATGHYLSALAQAYASTGDPKWKEKIDYMVSELAHIQEVLPTVSNGMEGTTVAESKPELIGNNRPGFLSAYPERQFILLEHGAVYISGATDATNINSVWAPYYTLHKIMAGLLDCYELAGNEQALTILRGMADWVHGRLSVLPQETLTSMWSRYIAGEYGGMNETLARLAAITGEEKYLETARLFDNPRLFGPTAEGQDVLNGLHANQHIPQITGALRVFDRTGDPFYYRVAKNFWDIVVHHHLFSNGGTGQGEFFRAPDTVEPLLGNNTAEQCATYNMLKLTRDLFFHNPSAEYMDYYERALYNFILASQDQSPANRGVVYFLPLGPGLMKSYGRTGFTCDVGTGMESQTKYQDSIYFRSADNRALYVNLYVPSTLHWEEKGFEIVQDTTFPDLGHSTLTINGEGRLDLKLRVPYWAVNGFSVKINGVEQPLSAVPGTYVTLSRNWQPGDRVDISMPYSLRFEPAPDNPELGSLFYGPIMLVAKDDRTTFLTFDLDPDNLQNSVVPADDGNPMHFRIGDVTFVPMYEAYNFRYHAYIKTM